MHGSCCGVHLGSLSAGHGDLAARLEIFNGFRAGAVTPSLVKTEGGSSLRSGCRARSTRQARAFDQFVEGFAP